MTVYILLQAYMYTTDLKKLGTASMCLCSYVKPVLACGWRQFKLTGTFSATWCYGC